MASAAILIVGNEILSGSTQDENSGWLAAELTHRGIDVQIVVTVPDLLQTIARWVQRLHGEHTYLFTSGGLGPTPDDVTREAIAKALQVKLELNPVLLRLLHQWLGREPVGYERRMAELPVGSVIVSSQESDVPVVMVRNIILLPGVPSLLRRMFSTASIVLSKGFYEARTLESNLQESQVAPVMVEFLKEFPHLRLGSYPHWRKDGYSLDLKLEAKQPGNLDQALSWLSQRLEELPPNE